MLPLSPPSSSPSSTLSTQPSPMAIPSPSPSPSPSPTSAMQAHFASPLPAMNRPWRSLSEPPLPLPHTLTAVTGVSPPPAPSILTNSGQYLLPGHSESATMRYRHHTHHHPPPSPLSRFRSHSTSADMPPTFGANNPPFPSGQPGAPTPVPSPSTSPSNTGNWGIVRSSTFPFPPFTLPPIKSLSPMDDDSCHDRFEPATLNVSQSTSMSPPSQLSSAHSLPHPSDHTNLINGETFSGSLALELQQQNGAKTMENVCCHNDRTKKHEESLWIVANPDPAAADNCVQSRSFGPTLLRLVPSTFQLLSFFSSVNPDKLDTYAQPSTVAFKPTKSRRFRLVPRSASALSKRIPSQEMY